MKITELKINNFMLFDKLDIKWSPNINIISGENSTGKTTLLKMINRLVEPSGGTIKLYGEDILEKDIVTEINKTYSVTDKLFGMWINSIYANGYVF